jgi:acetamidase/formamidase
VRWIFIPVGSARRFLDAAYSVAATVSFELSGMIQKLAVDEAPMKLIERFTQETRHAVMTWQARPPARAMKSRSALCFCALVTLVGMLSALAASNLYAADGEGAKLLRATPDTVHWGYYDNSLKPVLYVKPGEAVAIETVTHHSGDAPDLMMDDAIRAIYEKVQVRGPGPHILTGPIYVDGAEPGDTLEVRIEKLTARAATAYGANVSEAPFGILGKRFPKNRATIFKIDQAAGVARAVFAFDAPGDFSVLKHNIVPPQSVRRVPALKGVEIPLRLHLGSVGVAPASPGRVSSYPPYVFGGNMDDWRLGAGAKIFLPVFVKGALFSAGDPHSAQGDGEVDGTAIETSLNGVLRFFVRKDLNVRAPVIETPSQVIVMAFGEKDLNRAMVEANAGVLDWLTGHFGLSPDDAYAFMSVAVDFAVTQVVDFPRFTVSGNIPKAPLRHARGASTP